MVDFSKFNAPAGGQQQQQQQQGDNNRNDKGKNYNNRDQRTGSTYFGNDGGRNNNSNLNKGNRSFDKNKGFSFPSVKTIEKQREPMPHTHH